MALRFGWRASDKRETIWREDPALRNVPEGVIEDWRKDGDASHLRPFATGGQPTVFTFRALSFMEAQYVDGLNTDASIAGVMLQWAICFRLAVRFPDAPETYKVESTGQQGLRSIERVAGMQMLSEGVCNFLRFEYPGMTEFYGMLIRQASVPSEPEKKASSPPPILTPSSAEAPTRVDTAAPDALAAAAA